MHRDDLIREGLLIPAKEVRDLGADNVALRERVAELEAALLGTVVHIEQVADTLTSEGFQASGRVLRGYAANGRAAMAGKQSPRPVLWERVDAGGGEASRPPRHRHRDRGALLRDRSEPTPAGCAPARGPGMSNDLALIGALRDALDGCFEKRPGLLGVRHLRDCRLSGQIAMSDGIVESAVCEKARAALDAADARLGYAAWEAGA